MVDDLKKKMRTFEHLIGFEGKLNVTSRDSMENLIDALTSKYEQDTQNSLRLHRLEFKHALENRGQPEVTDEIKIEPEDIDDWKDLMTLSKAYYVLEHPRSEGLSWKPKVKEGEKGTLDDRDLVKWRAAQMFRLRGLEKWDHIQSNVRKLATEVDDEIEGGKVPTQKRRRKKKAERKRGLPNGTERKKPFKFTGDDWEDWTESYSDDSEYSGTEAVGQEIPDFPDAWERKIGEFSVVKKSSVYDESCVSEMLSNYRDFSEYRSPIFEEMDKAEDVEEWLRLYHLSCSGATESEGEEPALETGDKTDVKIDKDQDSAVKIDEDQDSTLKIDADRDSTIKIDEDRDSTLKIDEDRDSAIKIDEDRDSAIKSDEDLNAAVKINDDKDSAVKIGEDRDSAIKIDEDRDSAVKMDEDQESAVKIVEDRDSTIKLDEDRDSAKKSDEDQDGSAVKTDDDTDSAVKIAEDRDSAVKIAEDRDSAVKIDEDQDSAVKVDEDKDSVVKIDKNQEIDADLTVESKRSTEASPTAEDDEDDRTKEIEANLAVNGMTKDIIGSDADQSFTEKKTSNEEDPGARESSETELPPTVDADTYADESTNRASIDDITQNLIEEKKSVSATDVKTDEELDSAVEIDADITAESKISADMSPSADNDGKNHTEETLGDDFTTTGVEKDTIGSDATKKSSNEENPGAREGNEEEHSPTIDADEKEIESSFESSRDDSVVSELEGNTSDSAADTKTDGKLDSDVETDATLTGEPKSSTEESTLSDDDEKNRETTD